jgi:hypothetical protein
MQSIPLILKELNGRHDWIRTSDLFRVKKCHESHLVDGAVVINRHNRQKRPSGRYLRQKCDKLFTGFRAGCVGPARRISVNLHSQNEPSKVLGGLPVSG